MNIWICGAGCSLIDYLYTNVRFESSAFKTLLSRRYGDGGLSPGKLVFVEELERFAGMRLEQILPMLTGGQEAKASNLGGPSIVALIHAAQLLQGTDNRVSFFGGRGADASGGEIMEIVSRTPVDISGYKVVPGPTPFTIVLSDPSHDSGHGERTFINNIGAAGNFGPEDIDSDFFQGDIIALGGTALVPRLHERIAEPLRRAKELGKLTVVNTVYDFRSEKKHPESRWPIGDNDETYKLIDLFVADEEEALRTTGTSTIADATDFLAEHGVKAAIITCGPRPVTLFACGDPFRKTAVDVVPVSEQVVMDYKAGIVRGDTTGCGDNFVGGVLASLAGQLRSGKAGRLDIRLASCLGVVSGGHACYYVGGTYRESTPGEKRSAISRLYRQYRRQIGLGSRAVDGIIQ